MAFCEQCGALLSAGTKFCEDCGAPVESADKGVPQDCLSHKRSGSGWREEWSSLASSCGSNELGLIITREDELVSQIGADAQAFRAMIDAYIASARRWGVCYYYLNLDECDASRGGGEASSVIRALVAVVSEARPKYLMILGNEKIIDVVRWRNHADDGDEIVESDLCYSTLDNETPWNGQRYEYDEILRVGRVPSFRGEGLESFSCYFKNAEREIGGLSRVVPYGLSALVWKDESNDEYSQISLRGVDVSPAVTKDDVGERIDPKTNLMFFNVHGSNDTKYWYGQKGGSYPEAFEPAVLVGRDGSYFLGVEACYGAKYLGGLQPNQSIVLTALRNNCLAFLGSSRIAFGTSEPEGSCADIVIGNYIKYLAKGYSAGDAYIEGLRRLAAHPGSMDDSDIKTLAEFSLYGDPSARMMSSAKGVVSHQTGVSKGLFIPLPDVRDAVQMALAEVDAKIEAVIDDYVLEHMIPDLKRVGIDSAEQATYKMRNTGLNQKIYKYRGEDFFQVAKVYFDDNGKIHKAIISK